MPKDPYTCPHCGEEKSKKGRSQHKRRCKGKKIGNAEEHSENEASSSSSVELNVLPPEKKEEPKTAEKEEKVEVREKKPSIYERFYQLKTKEMRREEMEKKKTLEELFEESES